MSISNHTETKNTRKPVVLITMGDRELSGLNYQVLGQKYSDPIVRFSECVPVLVPTCYGADDLDRYLDMADGVYLSGASTNIDPSLYGETWETPDLAQDPQRDRFNSALIPKAMERGLPFLGVCRGHQELNISRGGNLYQKVHETEGKMDHREKGSDIPLDEMYGPHHPVNLVPDTWFAKALGQTEFMVNSLHGQGIKQLGKGLTPLAHAPDGLIEAMYCSDVSHFTLSLQWHPEWKTHNNPLWIKIFQMYGDACREFAAQRK